MRRRRKQGAMISASSARLLLFGICIGVGSVIGSLSGRFVSSDAREQLSAYLQAYVTCISDKAAAGSFFSVLASYLRYPLLAFAIGFLGGGIWLLPILCMAGGFSLAFSAQCFSLGFGRRGVLIALSLLGIRSIFVLPCTLYLAGMAWRSGRMRQPYDANDCVSFGLCFGILLIGTLLDLAIVPKLLRRVLL